MAREKAHIIAMKNGVPIGYIKSVSYARNTFSLTNLKEEAKGYASADHIQGEIDKLTAMAYSRGYIFIYD